MGSSCSGRRGIRTPGALRHGGFQDRCNRPLYHPSECGMRLAYREHTTALLRFAGAKVRKKFQVSGFKLKVFCVLPSFF